LNENLNLNIFILLSSFPERHWLNVGVIELSEENPAAGWADPDGGTSGQQLL
jgi:hypothetical protein